MHVSAQAVRKAIEVIELAFYFPLVLHHLFRTKHKVVKVGCPAITAATSRIGMNKWNHAANRAGAPFTREAAVVVNAKQDTIA